VDGRENVEARGAAQHESRLRTPADFGSRSVACFSSSIGLAHDLQAPSPHALASHRAHGHILQTLTHSLFSWRSLHLRHAAAFPHAARTSALCIHSSSLPPLQPTQMSSSTTVQKNPTRLFTAVTPPSTRVLTTRSVPLLRAMRSLHPTHPTTPQKREHPHTKHTKSPSPSTPPHTQVPSLSSSFSPLPPRAPRYPHIPPIPRLISSQSLSRHDTNTKTQHTKHASAHAPHCTATQVRHTTPQEAYR
jgi:hypothetical protein